MPEIVFRKGNLVRYDVGDTVRLTERIKEGGRTGRVYELGAYVNGEKHVRLWDVPADTPLTDGEIERGEFIYSPTEFRSFENCKSVYDIAGPGLSTIDILGFKHAISFLPKNPICVNIGASIGTSTIALLEERPGAFIFSIDIEPWEDEFDNLKRFELYDLHNVVRVLGRSQEIGVNWPIPVDLVFVDGGHRYEDVKEDIHVWLPKIKSGGMMVFHDYGMWHTPGVKRAVDEMMGSYKVIINIGVLKVFEI